MTARPRVLIRQMHLWLGLTLGALFAMLGLTGSALSFYVEIDALLHPEIRVETTAAAPGWSSPVWDRALGTARTRHPGETGIWSFEVTGRPGVIPARYYAPHHHHDDMEMLWIAPDGGRVLRDAPWGDYLMTWLYDLHMNLLAGDTGRQIIGWSGLVMVLLLATGLAVWWPRGTWAKALAFKRDAVPIRRLRDLHKLPGLWSWLLLLMFVVTGVMLALPGERDQLLSATVAPVADTPMPRSIPSERAPISVQTALTAGHRALPDARLAWIDVPGEPDGVFRLRVGVPGDPSQRFPHSLIYIDQFSGTVLKIVDARRGNASTTINNWLHPLHDGSVGGLATRILTFLCGLVPPTLFITGLLHWRRRRSARSAPRAARPASLHQRIIS